ncbi:MAG TPA: serine hydrolase domain-containing protein [Candidatus Dormibacteraeota bacterium]|jgi:CubicO group peptidase (beta-lactamase class C family)|nr:serine hydrolase domain-containing protein [Candidatus Dormibacteraeota bacterium]
MTTQTQPADLKALHAELEERVAEAAQRLGVPGVAVGLVAGGEEDYVFHGVTSIENPLDVEAGTLFQIGSTTKVYTGTVMMILAERGLVDLAAPVRTYIPELRLKDEDAARTVTVLQLLNHTAGWSGDLHDNTGDGDNARELFLDVLANAEQNSPPGKVASYNNAAVNIAGLVIERVTGKTYEAAVKDLLLDPLGLSSSYFFLNDVISRRFAVGHRKRNEEVGVARPYGLPRSVAPAGGIVSNAADQVRFARFHLGDGTAANGTRVLGEASLLRMREATASLHGSAIGDFVGISWLMRDLGGVRVAAHGGSTNGQQSSFDLVPSQNFGVTVLTNADEGFLLHREIVEWILSAYCGAVEPEPEPIDVTDDDLAPITGRYNAEHAYVDVTADGDSLVLNIGYTPEGERMLREIVGEVPESKPMRVKLIPGERFVVTEGEAKGMKGHILREDGAVRALNVGGRLAYRAE